MKFKIILLFITLLNVSCYKEGGNTFSAKSKIVGSWGVENLTVDGADSTGYIKANPNYCEYPITFNRYGDGRDYPPKAASECFAFYSTAYWSLKEHKKQLSIDIRTIKATGEELIPLLFNESIYIVWNIIRLKNEQMWLSSNIKGKEYFVKLKKKSA